MVTMDRLRLLLAVAGACMLVLGACGDDADDAAGDLTTTMADPSLDPVPSGVADTELMVTAGVQDDPERDGAATLRCGPAAAAGTGWLDGEAADEACAALERDEVIAAFDEPPDDLLCAQVYGGPSVATIDGTVNYETVVVELDRTDACAIERWDTLQALLPAPEA
jgi:hypothetical protein